MKYILSTLYALLFFVQLSAQSVVIFEENKTHTYLYEYERHKQNIKNEIFDMLARGNSIPPNRVSIKLQVEQNSMIIRQGKTLRLITDIEKTEVKGTTNYREFSLNHLLVPERIIMRADLILNKRNIAAYTADNSNVGSGKLRVLNIEQTDTLYNANYALSVSSQTFEYTQANKEKLAQHISFIDDYYRKNTKAQNVLRNLNNISTHEEFLISINDIETIKNYNNTAKEAAEFVAKTKKEAFYKTLDVPNNDPQNLLALFDAIEVQSAKIQSGTKNILENPEIFYYNKGLDELRKNNIVKAQSYFEQAVKENKHYAPAHAQLGVILFNNGFRKNAYEKIFLVKSLNPEPATDQINSELADRIYRDLLREASVMNNRTAYDDAIFLLNSAEQICSEFPRVRCLPAMDNELARAIKGKYYILTENAHAATKAGRLHDAERYTDQAYAYRKRHLQFIPETDEIVGLIYDLYAKFIETGRKHTASARYDQALANFDEAQRICNKYIEMNCDQRLDDAYIEVFYAIYENHLNAAERAYNARNLTAADDELSKAVNIRQQHQLRQAANENRIALNIKEALYNDFITKGRSKSANKEFVNALQFFDEALTIENNYGIRKNPELNQLIVTAATGLCLEYCKTGTSQVNTNNISAARRSYKDAQTVAAKYRIENIKEVKEALNELNNRIFEQECINAQKEFDVMFAEAQTTMNAKNYLQANAELNKALSHSTKYADCRIDESKIRNTQNQIGDAVSYQTLVENAKTYIAQGNYNAAVSEYNQAAKQFSEKNVTRFGLSHQELHKFAENQANDFINHTAFHLSKNSDYKNALLLLNTLKVKGYRARLTKNTQELLGSELAKQDFTQNPNSDRNTNITRHTQNERYFRFIKRAYKKQWQQLN